MSTTTGNWFFDFDDDEVSEKSFLLQVALKGITRNSIAESVNPYMMLYRSVMGLPGHWNLLGKTKIIQDDISPAFSEGFRINYKHDTDLKNELIKACCHHSRDGRMNSDELVGEVEVSLHELLRTFGTRLTLEIMRPKSNEACGRIEFIGEGLPTKSLRGGRDILDFSIKIMSPPRSVLPSMHPSLSGTSFFLTLSRQREDWSWSPIYRSAYIKRGSVLFSSTRNVYMATISFRLFREELVLGLSMQRKIRFQVLRRGRSRDGPLCIGTAILAVQDLMHDLESDSNVDLMLNEKIVGEFALITRTATLDPLTQTSEFAMSIEINFYDEENDAKEIKQKRRSQVLLLDSP